MSRSGPAKAAKYYYQCLFIGVNVVVIVLKKKKRLGRKAACPIRKDKKIFTDQRNCLDAKLYNQS